MSQIILCETMIDKSRHEEIGYVGLDVETREKRCYLFYDEQGKKTNCLHEFDPETLPLNSPNYTRVWASNYNRHIQKSNLPEAFQSTLNGAFAKHRAYNQQTGYNLPYFEENALYLQCFWQGRPFCFNEGAFVPIENLLWLYSMPVKELSSYDYEDIGDICLHELDHMKYSVFKLYPGYLWIKCGLDVYKLPFKKIPLANGDTFYLLASLKDITKSPRPSAAFDEIATEYECGQINSDYNNSYIDIGHDLDALCDGNIHTIRGNGSVDNLYEVLLSIDNSTSLLTDFQQSVASSVLEGEKEADIACRRLLSHYQKRKRKNG